MSSRLSLAFCFAGLVLSTPAAAIESWNCTFVDKTNMLPLNAHGGSKIEIDGEQLDWKDEVPVIGIGGRPVPDSNGGYEHRTATFHYRVLENNEVGIVAVSSEAQINADIGPLVGARVITISKPSGDLREGSVMAGGEYDLLTGHCQRN
jgi:hypothetical protein